MQEQNEILKQLEKSATTKAFRVVAFFFGLSALSLVISIVYNIVSGNNPVENIATIVILSMGFGIGLFLIWRYEQVGWALLLILIGLYGGVGYAFTHTSGLIVVALVVMLVAIGLISQLASQRFFLPYLIAVIMASTGLLLLDLYYANDREPVAEFFTNYALGLAIFLTLFVIYLLSRDFRNYPLRTKLVIAFLIVTLIPLGTLAGIQTSSTEDVLIGAGNLALAGAARQTAANIDDFLRNQKENIRLEAGLVGASTYFLLAENERAGSRAEQQLIELLKVFRDKDPLRIRSYSFLDLEGNVVLTYPETAAGATQVAETDYFQATVTGLQPYVSYIQFPTDSPNGFFYISNAVRTSNGQIVGIIRNEYNAAVFQDLITRATGLVGGQSFAALYDDEYLHLAHGNNRELVFRFVEAVDEERVVTLKADQRWPNLPESQASANLPDLAANLNQASRIDSFAVQAVPGQAELNQAAVATLDEQPWLIVFYQRQEVFLEPITEQVQSLVLLVLGVIVGVILVAIGVAQVLTAPIIRLNQVALQVAGGDLQAHADVQSEDEIGTLAATFNDMTAQLRGMLSGLEQRVEARTRDLTTSTAVSQRLSTILDPDQLIGEVAAQVQSAFNYYHVHIYVFNSRRDALVMAGGTGQAGQAMLASGHSLQPNQGLVGRAASNNEVVFVEDVRSNPAWVPHQLLPDTRTEAAIPIAVGNNVLGVLDVQHNVLSELTTEHLALLQSIANQVAIALQNSQLFTQSQRIAETEAMKNRISQSIQQADTVEQVLERAAAELGVALGAAYTQIELGNQKVTGGEG